MANSKHIITEFRHEDAASAGVIAHKSWGPRGKVYFFGLSDGSGIKIGYTAGPLIIRKAQLIHGQFSDVKPLFLCAVNGTPTHEKVVQDKFERIIEAGSNELFKPSNDLIQYINWLRQQWWVYLEEDDRVDEVPLFPEWMPLPGRRVQFAEEDPGDLIPRHRNYNGGLAGTVWDRFCTPTKTGDDFYTPTALIEAAKYAMGDIDLDVASHWQANRIHKIKKYYHIHLSAFDNPWNGRVWLNPPFGDNKPWFEQIIRYFGKEMSQLCILSPVWVFNTVMARPIIDRCSAMVLLSPSPSFWGHPLGRTGTNHPHSVVYLGTRTSDFLKAFEPHGIPMRIEA